jgi:hypothetical protein
VKSESRRHSRQVLALAVIIALVPLPVLAGEGTQPTPTRQTLRATAAKVVAREVAKSAGDGMEAARSGIPARASAAYAGRGTPLAAVRAEQEGTPGARSGSFFTTPAGVAVMAVLGLGVGYALYSAKHDRVHSAGKQ